jgi:hypothetical protein
MTYYDYSIAVNGVLWDKSFNSVWGPVFSPLDNAVVAPVKTGGKWYLAKDGQILWDRPFVQLWHQQFSQDGKRIAAIAAPQFGRWTVAVDTVPWSVSFSDYVTDLVMTPDGGRTACVFKDSGTWGIAVDGRAWEDRCDMAWKPVFSPDGRNTAAKVEKDGSFRIALNGNLLPQAYTRLETPAFSPDGTRLLVRGMEKSRCFRDVIAVG